MFRKMLVANNGAPSGERALKCALELAKRLEIDLTMICVEELPRVAASVDEVAEFEDPRRSRVRQGRYVGGSPGSFSRCFV